MNIGSLYRVKEWYWYLFPSKESAVHAAARPGTEDHPMTGATPDADLAPCNAAYFSNILYKENVTYFSPDSYLVFLEEDGKVKKVLTSDGLIGWVWFVDRYNESFEEVNQQ